MRTQVALITDIGTCRSRNEDNYVVMSRKNFRALEHDEFLINVTGDLMSFGVFDGMGGHAMGDIASDQASSHYIEKVTEYVEKYRNLPVALEQLLRTMNDEICSQASRYKTRLGTTATLMVIKGRKIHLASLGDSRCYRIRDKAIERLTTDHILDSKQDGSGSKGKLTQYLGIYENEHIIRPNHANLDAKQGDVYVLCTDGITDLIDDNALLETFLESNEELSTLSMRVYDEYLNRGSKDNMTMIAVKIS